MAAMAQISHWTVVSGVRRAGTVEDEDMALKESGARV
jgi:hypothetical protein